MKEKPEEIIDLIYYFFSDKGTGPKPTPEKENIWWMQTRVAFEIITNVALNKPAIPDILKAANIECVEIQKWFDFVKTNFAQQIDELRDYSAKKQTSF